MLFRQLLIMLPDSAQQHYPAEDRFSPRLCAVWLLSGRVWAGRGSRLPGWSLHCTVQYKQKDNRPWRTGRNTRTCLHDTPAWPVTKFDLVRTVGFLLAAGFTQFYQPDQHQNIACLSGFATDMAPKTCNVWTCNKRINCAAGLVCRGGFLWKEGENWLWPHSQVITQHNTQYNIQHDQNTTYLLYNAWSWSTM